MEGDFVPLSSFCMPPTGGFGGLNYIVYKKITTIIFSIRPALKYWAMRKKSQCFFRTH